MNADGESAIELPPELRFLQGAGGVSIYLDRDRICLSVRRGGEPLKVLLTVRQATFIREGLTWTIQRAVDCPSYRSSRSKRAKAKEARMEKERPLREHLARLRSNVAAYGTAFPVRSVHG